MNYIENNTDTDTDDPGAPALDYQVAGTHYRDMPIQPAEFIHRNGLGFIEGNVVKYVCRYRNKNGIEDLRKARHYLDMLIDWENGQ